MDHAIQRGDPQDGRGLMVADLDRRFGGVFPLLCPDLGQLLVGNHRLSPIAATFGSIRAIIGRNDEIGPWLQLCKQNTIFCTKKARLLPIGANSVAPIGASSVAPIKQTTYCNH